MRKAAYLLAWILGFATLAYGHQVVLTWTASTDAAANPTLGYNIYRSTSACPASGVPSGATRLNGSTPISGTTYTDTTVQVGTNCYYATATLNGVESVASNTAPAGVLPAAPTVFTVSGSN